MVHTKKNLLFCFFSFYKKDVMSTVVAQEIIFIVLFIFYVWLCLVFVAARELSQVAVSQASPPVVVHGLLTAGASLAAELGL